MRPLRLVMSAAAVLACVVSMNARAQDSTSGGGDPYRDFRIPTHRWSSWSVDGEGNGTADFQESPTESRTLNGLSTRFGTTALWGFDSDRSQHLLFVDFSAFGNRSTQDVRSLDSALTVHDVNRTRALNELLQAQASLRIYPWRPPVGIDVSVGTALGFDQLWSSQHSQRLIPGSEERSASSSRQHQRQFAVVGSLAFGLGKVRDATAIYQTQLLEDRLLATGHLVRPLSAAARAKVAALFYAAPQFKNAHERPVKFFWREIEHILREDGALSPQSLEAYFSLFRVVEPAIAGVSFIRRNGFFVGPAVFLTAQRGRIDGKVTNSLTTLQGGTITSISGFETPLDVRSHTDEARVGGTAEWHRPFGPRWQADAFSSASYRDQDHSLQESTNVTARWLVADRWTAFGVAAHAAHWTGVRRDASHPEWIAALQGGLTYFIEDSWGAQISVATSQQHASNLFLRQSRVVFGVTYLVSGLLDLPGVIAPQRLLRSVR